MIAKILFFALLGAAYVQEGLSKFPRYHVLGEDDENVLTQTNPKGDKSVLEYGDGEEYVDQNLEGIETEITTEKVNKGFNELYEFHIDYHPQEVTTHRVEEANDNAHEEHIHHNLPPLVTEKSPDVQPVTENPTRKPSVNDFFDVFGHAINEVVNENAHNFNREVGSVMNVGKSVVDAAKTIADSKIKLANSFPRIGMKFLDDWEKLQLS